MLNKKQRSDRTVAQTVIKKKLSYRSWLSFRTLYANTLGLPNPLGFSIGYSEVPTGAARTRSWSRQSDNRGTQDVCPWNGYILPELYVRYQKSGGVVRQ